MTTVAIEHAPATVDDAPSTSVRGIAVIVGWAAVVLLALLVQWYSFWQVIDIHRNDLTIFRDGGALVRSGSDLYGFHFWAGYWTYPPFGALIMVPLTVIPSELLFPVWTGISLVALVVIVVISTTPVRQTLRTPVARVSMIAALTGTAVAITPVSDALGMGQVGILLVAGCLVDIAVLGRRESRWQGVLVGVAAAVKLTPGLFIVYFVVRRQWRAASLSILTIAACWGLSAAIHPGDTRTYFGQLVMLHTNSQIGGDGYSSWNQSLFGLTYRWIGGTAGQLAYVLLALLVLTTCLAWARRAADRQQLVAAASLVGLASVLVSPIAWHHHAVWVVPALGAVLGSGRDRRRVAVSAAIAIALMVPAPIMHSIAWTDEAFVLLYVALIGALLWTIEMPPPDHAPQTASGEQVLNTAPEDYFRDAYEPVMYSGAIGVYSDLVHRLMERRYRSCPTPVILELGAGAGQHFRYVTSAYERYYETDLSAAEPLPVTRTVSQQPIRGRLDAQDLSSFADASVDRVIATCLLAHLPDPERALNEWRRVLRPGGFATIYVPAEPGFLLRLLRRLFVVPKARRLGQDHLAIIYRDHRNHYPAMRSMIHSTFAHDSISSVGFPTRRVGWNLRLFDIYYVTKSGADILDGAHQSNVLSRST